jgi:hypothetical protein
VVLVRDAVSLILDCTLVLEAFSCSIVFARKKLEFSRCQLVKVLF